MAGDWAIPLGPASEALVGGVVERKEELALVRPG